MSTAEKVMAADLAILLLVCGLFALWQLVGEWRGK